MMNGKPPRTSAAILTALTFVASAVGQYVETQTDWFGGPGEAGPVKHWQDRFDTSDQVAWRSIEGQLALSSVPRATPLQRIVAGDADNPRSVAVGDLDGDGLADVISSDPIYEPYLGAIYWWANTGEGDFIRHTVDDDFYGVYHVGCADIDDDGDTDVLGAAYYGVPTENGRYAWFENLNGDATAWTQHLVGAWFWGAQFIDAGDIDGDGDLDLLGASYLTDIGEQNADVVWFENLDGLGDSWEQHNLDHDFSHASQIRAADLDGDGDNDVIAGNSDDFAWWENVNGDGTAWIKRTITIYTSGCGYLDVGDIDNDGDLDFIGAGYHWSAVRWWENVNGDGQQWRDWDVTILVHGLVIDLADLDGDGDLDALIGNEPAYGSGGAHWVENVTGDGAAWHTHTLKNSFVGPAWTAIGDLDGDGKLDAAVCCEDHYHYEEEQISWWNLTRFRASGQLTGSILDGGEAPVWGTITWEADVHADASLTIKVRASDDENDLGSFVTVTESGEDLGDLIDPTARFLQCRAELSTESDDVSPVLRELGVEIGIPGDLDGDGCVDQADLGILLAAWQTSAEGDLNCDGVTDQIDLGILLGHWGEGCP